MLNYCCLITSIQYATSADEMMWDTEERYSCMFSVKKICKKKTLHFLELYTSCNILPSNLKTDTLTKADVKIISKNLIR